MITLHPVPQINAACPACSAGLVADGWYMPGMRPLAALGCPACGRRYYGDLPVAQALYTPMLLDAGTGQVFDAHGVPWFAKWLAQAYAARSNEDIGFTVRTNRPVRRPLVLNCLDRLYGHALLKLFNAQYYIDHRPDVDLILLVPRYLQWLVPDGVAEVWSVDLPLRRGAEWNDRLAAQITQRVQEFGACLLSVALPHPHPADVAIQRFTRVAPSDEALWATVTARPVVTFIWRDDRVWGGHDTPMRKLADRLGRAVGAGSARADVQRQHVVALAELLLVAFPSLVFRVVGPGAKDRGRVGRP